MVRSNCSAPLIELLAAEGAGRKVGCKCDSNTYYMAADLYPVPGQPYICTYMYGGGSSSYSSSTFRILTASTATQLNSLLQLHRQQAFGQVYCVSIKQGQNQGSEGRDLHHLSGQRAVHGDALKEI